MDKRSFGGLIILVIGLILIFIKWFLAIYGVPLLIIGLIILLNKKEDNIEQIKFTNKKGGKK